MQLSNVRQISEESFATPFLDFPKRKWLMRISLLSVMLSLFFVSYAYTSKGQNLSSKKVTVAFHDAPLKEVFKKLESLSGFNFSYKNADIRNMRPVTFSASDVSLATVLTTILNARQLMYVQNEDNIIVVHNSTIPDGNLEQIATSIDSTIQLVGKVVNEDDVALVGATVSIVHANVRNGSKIAFTTDKNGAFGTRVQKGKYLITVSYIGYESQKMQRSLNSKDEYIKIVLKPQASSLKEVVVNGIFERPTENFTGAARTITSKQLRQVGNRNVLDALKSIDPSFRIPENLNFGSDPNHLAGVQMRGTNSIQNLSDGTDGISLKQEYQNNPNLPLFILNDFEVTLQKIYDLDMNRILSVTLLKDASATAIYGSRAANGVLVIQTIPPKKGKLKLSYSGNFTLNAPDLSSYDLLDASEKLQLEKAAGIYDSFHDLPDEQQDLDELYNLRLAAVKRGVNTYWLSKPLRTAFGQKHSINVEGGDEAMRYNIDLSYNNDANGVMKGSGRTTYYAGVDLIYNIKRFRFQNSLSVTYNTAKNSPYGSFRQYSSLNPYWQPLDSMGNISQVLEDYSSLGESAVFNPMYDATLNTKNIQQYLNVTENFQAEWNVSQAFKMRAQFSLYTQKNQSDVFKSALANEFATGYTGEDYFRRGRYSLENGNSFNYQGTVTLNYGKAFGKNTLYATAGMQLANDQNKIVGVRAEGFPNDVLDDIDYANLYEKNGRPYGSDAASRSVGYLANASYAYDNRYLVDASFRMDGSSKFGADKRFAPFWSLGLGWNMHKEAFFKPIKFINRLKLRASYGVTGSQSFPSYLALTSYQYLVSERYRNGVGAVLMGIGNSDLKWQQTPKTNIGADIDLFKSRIVINANYYIEKSNGLITNITTPPSVGFSSYVANLGKIQNTGAELYLTAFLIKKAKQDIYWSVTANFFHDESKILEISDALKQQNQEQQDQQAGENGTTSPVILYKEGGSMSTIWAVRSLGIDPSNGYEIYVKKDGTLTNVWDARDQVPVGNSESKVYGTFGTNVMYKGFSLNIAMRTNLGGDYYNQTLADRVENASLYQNVDSRVLYDRWQKPGDNSLYKGVVTVEGDTRTDVTKATSRFVQRNNTLYCDAITLGYQFSNDLVKKWNMSRLQTYFYINNPFVVSSVKQERGLGYPFARSFSLTIQASF